MGIMHFDYRSEAIGGYVTITVVYPTDAYSYAENARSNLATAGKPVYRPGMKFQTIYLLHGGGDDDTLTYRYTNAERYAQSNHVMLVTPNIMNSFGVNTQYHVRYMDFVTEELPVVIQSLFASSPAREDNFIVGYAMGGNAALGCALTHPELYSECVDMSGGIGLTLQTERLQSELVSDHFANGFALYCSTFGKPEDLPGSQYDMRAAAEKLLASDVKPPYFRFMIGGSEPDFIYDRAVKDAEAMKDMGFDCSIEIYPGKKHDFDFWDEALRQLMNEKLPLKRAAIYPDK